jgi:Domain of unknown function (DUF4411)
MTLYLLDANVLIRAHEDYYPVDRIPQYWAWLLEKAAADIIKMPRRIFDEVTPPPGPFADWLKQPEVKDTLVLKERAMGVQLVLQKGYAPDLDDVEIEKIGKDPFLIAAAMAGPDRVVVTKEVSKPKLTRANRKVPDVCDDLGVLAITDFRLYNMARSQQSCHQPPFGTGLRKELDLCRDKAAIMAEFSRCPPLPEITVLGSSVSRRHCVLRRNRLPDGPRFSL